MYFLVVILMFFKQGAYGTNKSLPEPAAPFDVVINEIMVRPSSSAGLPQARYIELYNRSDSPVNLNRWTIRAGTGYRSLPYHIIRPGGFLLISHDDHRGMLDEFGDVVYFPGFPVLPPGGQTIVLSDEYGNVISAVEYSDKWYRNALKAAGGWSLEQIDPFNPCGGEKNWTASSDSRGGTPGSPNSVMKNNPDNFPPELIRAGISGKGEPILHFSEPMHPLSLWNTDNYHAGGLGNPVTVTPAGPFSDKVTLQFGDGFDEGAEYLLTVSGVYDCAGNVLDPNASSARFKIPTIPADREIVINEILFNPFPGGVDFIELYNNSRETFDLKQVVLTGISGSGKSQDFIIAPGGWLFFPEEYVVLSVDPEIIMNHYYTPAPGSLIAMERLPQLNNESGKVRISTLEMEIIDLLDYRSDMHSPLLAAKKGVSLERINYNRPSSDPTNWTSASETAGFATPGYKNSQFSDMTVPTKKVLSIDPPVFSPDNSGYNDVVNIYYDLEKPGYSGTIRVFDSRGRIVRKLVRNELLGTSGVYSWDGRNDGNQQAGLGIYLILLELFHPDGDVRKYKEVVVLAGKLAHQQQSGRDTTPPAALSLSGSYQAPPFLPLP
jgi:hypothetical protein